MIQPEHPLFPPATRALMKQARMLQQAQERRDTGWFVAEGVKVVTELLQSGLKIHAILGLEECLNNLSSIRPGDFYFSVKPKDLEYISSLKTPNQVVAVAHQATGMLHEKLPDSSCIVLDRIADPGNMGTIIRTSEWFGIRHILCSADSVDCWSPKVVQSAMGSLFRTPPVYCDLEKTLEAIADKGSHRIIGASLSGGILQPSDSRPFALVIGSESHGISPELLELIPEQVLIPKNADAPTESLNAAVACGILLYSITKK